MRANIALIHQEQNVDIAGKLTGGYAEGECKTNILIEVFEDAKLLGKFV